MLATLATLGAVDSVAAAEALSGPAGQYGQSIRNGLMHAVDEINAAGGVKGKMISLLIEDEQGNKEQAIDSSRG